MAFWCFYQEGSGLDKEFEAVFLYDPQTRVIVVYALGDVHAPDSVNDTADFVTTCQLSREEEEILYTKQTFGGGPNWFKKGKNLSPLTIEEIAAERKDRAFYTTTGQTSNVGLTELDSFEQQIMAMSPRLDVSDTDVNQSQTVDVNQPTTPVNSFEQDVMQVSPAPQDTGE